MPTYEYKCERCGEFEVEQKISDSPFTTCPRPRTRSAGERSAIFNDSVGTVSWGGRSAAEHPHRCACQDESTPHVHYSEPPYACARCGCAAYSPLIPVACGAPVRRLIPGSTNFVLNGDGWAKDGYRGSRG